MFCGDSDDDTYSSSFSSDEEDDGGDVDSPDVVACERCSTERGLYSEQCKKCKERVCECNEVTSCDVCGANDYLERACTDCPLELCPGCFVWCRECCSSFCLVHVCEHLK